MLRLGIAARTKEIYSLEASRDYSKFEEWQNRITDALAVDRLISVLYFFFLFEKVNN